MPYILRNEAGEYFCGGSETVTRDIRKAKQYPTKFKMKGLMCVSLIAELRRRVYALRKELKPLRMLYSLEVERIREAEKSK